MSLYHETKFSLYFSFTVSYFYEKDKRVVVLEYFYLLHLLFWEILTLNLSFAICHKGDSIISLMATWNYTYT